MNDAPTITVPTEGIEAEVNIGVDVVGLSFDDPDVIAGQGTVARELLEVYIKVKNGIRNTIVLP